MQIIEKYEKALAWDPVTLAIVRRGTRHHGKRMLRWEHSGLGSFLLTPAIVVKIHARHLNQSGNLLTNKPEIIQLANYSVPTLILKSAQVFTRK